MSIATTTFNFDEVIERRGTDSGKWNKFDPDVIPMWTADMDFRSPPAVIQALHDRVEHGIFGYGYGGWTHQPAELLDVLRNRMATRYQWDVAAEDIVFVPNIVSAIYAACRAAAKPGEAALVQTPNYWPFFNGIEKAQLQTIMAPVTAIPEGKTLRYEVDFEALEAAITPQTKLFILGNPHNPIGRVYEKWELERFADICLRHDLIICSDEIHCDLVYEGHRHIPIASLSPEIAQRTLTLMAPSKTFNVPGLKLGFAVSQNHDLLAGLNNFYADAGVSVGVIGYTAALAAYRDGQSWLEGLLRYLQGNRDYAVQFISENLPGIVPVVPEATYLLFMDCRETDLEGDPCDFFLEKARVALSGAFDSQGYERHTRLNYGCPRTTLVEGLERMRAAMTS
ncbi:MAG: PatB family C-S lyase [Anaerolineae bacterium]|nr:PatB family C-S lyase [Anaerolineae bacterium]